MFVIQHCFICRPSLSEDAGNVVTLAYTAMQTLITGLDLFRIRLDLIHIGLDLIHIRLDLIHIRLNLIHTRPDLKKFGCCVLTASSENLRKQFLIKRLGLSPPQPRVLFTSHKEKLETICQNSSEEQSTETE
jgi:hypothetical protein